MKEKDVNSLDHTTWRYQYHVVFAPEYRRLEICGSIKADMVQAYKTSLHKRFGRFAGGIGRNCTGLCKISGFYNVTGYLIWDIDKIS